MMTSAKRTGAYTLGNTDTRGEGATLKPAEVRIMGATRMRVAGRDVLRWPHGLFPAFRAWGFEHHIKLRRLAFASVYAPQLFAWRAP